MKGGIDIQLPVDGSFLFPYLLTALCSVSRICSGVSPAKADATSGSSMVTADSPTRGSTRVGPGAASVVSSTGMRASPPPDGILGHTEVLENLACKAPPVLQHGPKEMTRGHEPLASQPACSRGRLVHRRRSRAVGTLTSCDLFDRTLQRFRVATRALIEPGGTTATKCPLPMIGIGGPIS
jgi:hypothetical protein